MKRAIIAFFMTAVLFLTAVGPVAASDPVPPTIPHDWVVAMRNGTPVYECSTNRPIGYVPQGRLMGVLREEGTWAVVSADQTQCVYMGSGRWAWAVAPGEPLYHVVGGVTTWVETREPQTQTTWQVEFWGQWGTGRYVFSPGLEGPWLYPQPIGADWYEKYQLCRWGETSWGGSSYHCFRFRGVEVKNFHGETRIVLFPW